MPTTLFVYEYITNPATDTVHLVRQEAMARGHDGTPIFTECGRRVYAEWVGGDETLSGVAATCATCRNTRGTP